jgi:serine/threonine protein kinase/Tol biopolymer transport system component
LLNAGSKLGPYEITGAIGAGGMGEVYQAHDTKLGRDVAIKILPEAFAHDPERLSRFQREAKMLAALNHPNIATIYGLEQSNGTNYLVMELVSGETLAERVKRDGAVPIEEALAICKQIAEALEAAHEKGIIHRDLKPANVKVTPEGKVKVLDFGLAKAFEGDAVSSNPSESPTLSRAATMQGVILGTAAYMSPEQARGKAVDKRTDIWAFGCVLYELLCGRPAFEGEDITEILAAVVKTEPDWNRLPESTPPALRTLLRRCLRKDMRQRFHDTADVRIEIEEALTVQATLAPAVPKVRNAAIWRWALLSGITCLLVGSIVTGTVVWKAKPDMTPQPVSRLAVELPISDELPLVQGSRGLAISPDGSRIAFVATHEGKQQIYLRAMNSLESKAVPGTERAVSPFFSPDGKWLGFSVGGKLKKIMVDGGAPLVLCEAPNVTGVTWGDNDTIVFARQFGNFGLSKVSAAGGKPEAITTRDPTKEEESHRWPELLPGGKAVLFTQWSRNLDDAQIVVQRLDEREPRVLVRGGSDAHYLPTGHLVYARAGILLAVPFDLSRLEVTGNPIPVAEGVSLSTEGVAQFSISNTGSLAYVPGGLQGAGRKLVWLDRNGVEQPLAAPPRAYQSPRLSPDGQRIAVVIQGANDDIWVYDIPLQTFTRLTFAGRNLSPLWTPDGKRIIFRASPVGGERLNLFWKLADGSGEAERLTVSDYSQTPNSLSPDGQVLVFSQLDPTTNYGLWMLPLTGDRKPRPFLQTPRNEAASDLSPDGHWLAYTSDESGQYEIYLRPFPTGGAKWQISTEGGVRPFWTRNGELLYPNGDRMMAVSIATQPTLSVGTPRLLFERNNEGVFNYDVTRDGQRFLMLKPSEQESAATTQIVVVQNWFEELKQKVPTGKK